MRKDSKRIDRLGEERLNNQGCLMKIIEYIDNKNVIVEFQDEHKARVNVRYDNFVNGQVKNQYFPNVCNIGITGNKYITRINNQNTKEYGSWVRMLKRCYDKKEKEKYPTYKDVTCCDEWLYFPNFYEWLHSQQNFDKWYKGKRWALDKDILNKGNKIYSPETCCLVPQNVNSLFVNQYNNRGILPIGIHKSGIGFVAKCSNPIIKKEKTSNTYKTSDEAFYLWYKPYKENLIKQIAQIEYDDGNITEKCYNAMLNYKVEITD